MTLENLPIKKLRKQWAQAWGQEPHLRIGRVMLEKSLVYKMSGGLSQPHQERLDQLTKEYKRNPTSFSNRTGHLKPGVRLVRTYNGRQHNVLVTTDGFDYQGHIYFSLSKIANKITGKHWNGWVFFGLKSL